MIGQNFNNSLNTLTYLQFKTLGADAARTHLATLFGSGTDFNAKRFCDWYQLNVTGKEYWFRTLPLQDMQAVFALWKVSLPQTDTPQQQKPLFLPEFTIAKAKADQHMVQKSSPEHPANSSISTHLHHKI